MQTVTYESLRADQAWLIVSDQLNQRNTVLSQGISQMERDPSQLSIASRLMILRYHLRHGLRQLTSEARQQTPSADNAELQRQQWMHIHQLAFLLRQIDTELANARHDSGSFRALDGVVRGPGISIDPYSPELITDLEPRPSVNNAYRQKT